MCGRLVGGVGPKMKSCYLLRVKQRLAFCCPLLPNKLFSVFSDLRLLPGVLRFACSTGETQFSANFCGEIAELSLCLTNFCVATICLTKKCLFGNGLKKNVHYPPNNKQPDILFSELMHFQSICFTP